MLSSKMYSDHMKIHRTVFYPFQLKLWRCNFLGVATGQTSLQITSCVTKNQNLEMYCKFTPASGTNLPKICFYMMENKLVASTNSTSTPAPEFKNRANVSIVDNTCKLLLTGFSEDKPQNYTCFIKQTASASVSAIVEKSKMTKLSYLLHLAFCKENNIPY